MTNQKTTDPTEEELRAHIRSLREFYTNFSMYAFVNALLFITWVITGLGHFWPFWTILFWGVALAIQAMNSGLLSEQSQEWINTLLAKLPFLKNTWEDEQVSKMSKRGKSKPAPSSNSAPTPKTTDAKPVATKPAATKTPVKAAAKPTPKPAAKPATKAAVKPVVKTAPKPAAKKAPAKPVTKTESNQPVGKIY